MRIRKWLAALLAVCLLASAVPALTPAAQAAPRYYITVDITNQIVTVYENGNRTKTGIVAQFICSTGKSGTPTPTGTFALPRKSRSSERTEWYSFPAYSCYAKWATRIIGGILFHSVIYNYRGGSPTSTSVNALGSRASHGCVRLRVPDAKFIAQNCGAGTLTKIYYSGKRNNDLRRRLKKRSFYRSSESYNHFLGINDTLPLSFGSGGDLVKKLQRRLRALGYFTGSIGGNFQTLTRSAVRAFQKDAGLTPTGVVNKALWDRIFAANAPVGTRVTLGVGASGPVVGALQEALTALKFYTGPINGTYDEATRKAVRRMQQVRSWPIANTCTPSQQKNARRAAAILAERFGNTPYVLVTHAVKTPMAEVTATKATVYAKASKTSAKLATLKKGAKMTVLSQNGTWANVQSGSATGWMLCSKLRFYTHTRITYEYVAEGTGSAAPDASPVTAGALPPEDVQVLIGMGGAKLYADASLSGAAIAEIPAGSLLIALDVVGDAIAVSYDGREGYIPAEAEAEPDADEPEAEEASELDGEGLALALEAPPAEAAPDDAAAIKADDAAAPVEAETVIPADALFAEDAAPEAEDDPAPVEVIEVTEADADPAQ